MGKLKSKEFLDYYTNQESGYLGTEVTGHWIPLH